MGKLLVNGSIEATSFLGNLDWNYITNKPSTFSPSSHTHNQIVSRGNVTAESGTNWPAYSGISMSQVYSNGYPTTYGNVLTLYGGGCGQLLIGWSGTSGANAPAYIRSKRDTTDANWSSWQQLATTDGSINYSNSSGYASSAGNSSTCNGIALEWSGSIAWADTGWIAAWSSDGTKIKALNKNSFAPASHSHSYLPLSGGTMTGALNFANGTWNLLGDDCYFGDNNTAGSFAIKGTNGTTNLKMVQYGGSAYGTISFDGSVFTFSNVIQLNTSNWTSTPNVGNAPLQFSPWSIDAITSSTYYKPWFGGSHGISGSGYYNTIVCGIYHTNDPSRAGFYIGASWDHNNADTFYHFARDGHFITPRLVTNNYGSSFPSMPYNGEVFFKI